MIRAGDLRTGKVISYNGQLYEVIEAQHFKPGKGGAFMKAKMRNIKTGSTMVETLRPEEVFPEIFTEQKQMQYLYRDDLGLCLMDEETFEQVHISEEKVGEKIGYLKENMSVTVKFCDGQPLTIDPPIHVVLEIIETEPGFKGDTVSGATKPAKLETGKTVKVPLFVERGQRIKVDTRTGEYIERA